MGTNTESFYDDLAQSYHLLFADWNRSMARQAAILGPILERVTGKGAPYVLDCACGIGTQAIGLAERGHAVVATDLSRPAIERAKAEARLRNLEIQFRVADMRRLSDVPEGGFDAVLAADNALPHLLTQAELEEAIAGMAAKLTETGVIVATLRDYDDLIATRPTVQPPAFHGEGDEQRIVHQVWQWQGNEYTVHLYLTLPVNGGWTVKHFHARYRGLLRAELYAAFSASGFSDVQWLEPDETSFYQPIVIAGR